MSGTRGAIHLSLGSKARGNALFLMKAKSLQEKYHLPGSLLQVFDSPEVIPPGTTCSIILCWQWWQMQTAALPSLLPSFLPALQLSLES